MVRKRSAATRARDLGRKRKARSPAGEGWTLAELAALGQVSPRTIGEYIGRGLLTSPEFRGTATRYNRQHLLRLLAIRLMRDGGSTRIKSIKLKLEAMGNRDIETWVLARKLRPAVAAALGATAQPAAQTSSNASMPASKAGAPKVPTQTWRRLQLMPGLELSVRDDASPLVHEIAAHVYTQLEQLVGQALRDANA